MFIALLKNNFLGRMVLLNSNIKTENIFINIEKQEGDKKY